MGMVGCLGDIVFTVSDRTIETINNVTWSGSARYATHQRHGTHALTEFTGLDPDKMTFDIVLSAYLGVDPTSRLRSPTTSAAGSPLRQPRQTTSGPTRRTMAALTAPPSEYRPHNESPLTGFHRPVEGAFSVFRRFRVYGGAGAFFAFGWASTLPRHKGGVATRLRACQVVFPLTSTMSTATISTSRSPAAPILRQEPMR